MAVLESLIQSIELWLKLSKKHELVADPDLDPVILVPGIAGSVLNAVDDDGNEERVWVRLLEADREFRAKLWSRFDPSTGKTVSFDEKTRIVVPEDRYGLYAVDVLDPEMFIGQEGVCYYHDMILEMIKWGYQEGKTLFGFGYDFRQSNRLQDTLDQFSAKLESVYRTSGGKKINIITHSMGGLLVKCFMSLHSDIFEKYVKNWIAIASPFQGAPGYITTSLLNGVSFVDGWEQFFFISRWSMHQLLIECPSIYELMANPDFNWENVPVLQVWREKLGLSGNLSTFLESFEPNESLSLMKEALSSNTVGYDGAQIHLPFNLDILQWANETYKVLSRAKVPSTVKFYNIYGINYATAHSVCYGSEEKPISDLKQLTSVLPKYICVNGDGTVPVESAKADGLDAVARVGVEADHRGIVCDRHVFRILKHWLKAGEPDPFYNPLNDYVILPTAFEMERHHKEDMVITAFKEEWELISPNSAPELSKSGGAISVSCVEEQPLSGTQATVVVHPQIDGKQHVEVRALSVTVGG